METTGGLPRVLRVPGARTTDQGSDRRVDPGPMGVRPQRVAPALLTPRPVATSAAPAVGRRGGLAKRETTQGRVHGALAVARGPTATVVGVVVATPPSGRPGP